MQPKVSQCVFVGSSPNQPSAFHSRSLKEFRSHLFLVWNIRKCKETCKNTRNACKCTTLQLAQRLNYICSTYGDLIRIGFPVCGGTGVKYGHRHGMVCWTAAACASAPNNDVSCNIIPANMDTCLLTSFAQIKK